MLLDLKLPPGVFRQGTAYQAKGRWFDANLVRWFEGAMRPLGGWREYRTDGNAPVTVMGKARGMHSWRSNDADRFAAIGTHTNLYAFGSRIAGTKNITPVGLVAGFADNEVNTGYGGGAYGISTYGTPRTARNIVNFATSWSMDNFGEFLVAVNSQDGRLFSWDLMAAAASPVVATTGMVPTMNKGVIVTDERFAFLLQAGGNRRRIAWADQESLTRWEVTATSQAGDFELQTPGEVMTAKKVPGKTLILTSTDAHAATYIGPPLVYGFERVGTGCGCISRNAAAVADKSVFWMSDNGFWRYETYAQNLPSEVGEYVFGRLNRGQLAKVWAVHNNDFGEVTWYYPSGMEVDSYVTYNYRENHWSVGSLTRTIGVDNSVFPTPLRVDPNGMLYEHEVGFNYDNNTPYAETGPLELGNGANVYMAKYLYPDERTQGDVQARFATKFYPNAPEFAFGPYSMANPTSIRFTGRQVVMRVEGTRNADWRVGVPRMDVEAGGLR